MICPSAYRYPDKSWKNENLDPHENLFWAYYVYTSIVHNHPKLETAWMFFIDK